MQKKRICCNQCGNVISLGETVEKVDYLKIQKNWGYFSKKDGSCHKINICESCYDKWVKTFVIPLIEEENTELL